MCNDNVGRRRGKLETEWFGPYLIEDRTDNNVSFRDLCTGRVKVVDIDVLKPFIHGHLEEGG